MPLPSIPDYSNYIRTPQMVHPHDLQDGHPIEKGMNVVKYAGGFCVVFPYQTPKKKYAVRCWHAEVADAKDRLQKIAQALKNSALPYFVGLDYYEDGIMTSEGIQPIVVMDWVEAKPLKHYIANHINESNKLNELAENFKKMVGELHQQHFAHGDLQHGNIMVKDDGSLVLVDYDSMYVPALDGKPDEIKGLAGYQHLARWKNKNVNEKIDYFSELVIYLSLRALAIKPSYWNDLNIEDTETMLFSGDDIKSGGSAPIFSELRHYDELTPLVDKLCEFMHCQSIEDLTPLENAIVSVSDSIASKWGNYVPPKPNVEIDNADDIAKGWANGNGYKPQSSENMANDIASKW